MFTSKLHTVCRFCDFYLSKTCMRSKKCMILTRVHKTCIYSKKSTFWCHKCAKPAYTQKNQSFDSEKSPNLHLLYSKKQKKQKPIHLRQSVPHRVCDFWFFVFLSICRFGDFSQSKLLICLSICRFCLFWASKCWSFLSICRFGEPQVSQTYIFAT